MVHAMARTYPFIQVDVFTDHIFGGNQLAVFSDPAGLSDAEMQAIAREMNFSETTFVVQPTRPDAVARVRIFTGTRELPFAGHPTLGTAWVLASQSRLPAGQAELALEEGIGLVPVRLEGELSAPDAIWMAHRPAEFGPPVANPAEVAEALGLTTEDLLVDQPILVGSTGVAFLYVPLTTPDAVDRVVANTRALAQAAPGDHLGVFVFAPDPARGSGRVYSRMFAPDTLGITEDAATGGASGALGAYIAERSLVELGAHGEIVSLQGNRMGRPSSIRIRLELREGRAAAIQVGGSVVPVLEGTLTLPDGR
jgi:trans-2,3-dihydro-3-hydroxyanthranilate isomerase